MKVKLQGLEIKQILVGIYRYQWDELEEARREIGLPRSVLVRDAIDLWMRARRLAKERGNGVAVNNKGKRT